MDETQLRDFVARGQAAQAAVDDLLRCRSCGHPRGKHLDRYGRNSPGGHECSLCPCPLYLPPAAAENG
jgi:hypothetical protein